MRGKVGAPSVAEIPAGITPAHAGKRIRLDAKRRGGEDHPRPCGEKRRPGEGCTAQRGSPPPMRGKESSIVSQARRARITPAHAGKSSAAQYRARSISDHPRPCGEKPRPRLILPVPIGSPPPMRGKGAIGAYLVARCRITPAHAGKRGVHMGLVGRAKDHPRPCGEKRVSKVTLYRSMGSPPPMRGKGRVFL